MPSALIKRIIFFLMMLSALPDFGQGLFFTVVDENTKEPIPFVNVHLKGKDVGTNSNMKGEFSIEFADSDTIVISAIGYEGREFLGQEIKSSILLKQKSYQLNEVTVRGSKIRRIRLGNDQIKEAGFFRDSKIFVTLIKNSDLYGAVLKDIEIHLEHPATDKFKYILRPRIFANVSSSPGEDLLKNDLVIEIRKNQNKILIDLETENITLPIGGCFIGVEFIGYYDEKNRFVSYHVNPAGTEQFAVSFGRGPGNSFFLNRQHQWTKFNSSMNFDFRFGVRVLY